MNCEEILEIITASKDLADLQKNQDLQNHLEHCESCRVFAEEWLVLKDVNLDTKEPPMSLDFLIQREAQRFTENRQVRKQAVIRWFSVAATAACVLFGFLLVLSMLNDQLSPKQGAKDNQPDSVAQQNNIQTHLTPEQNPPVKVAEQTQPESNSDHAVTVAHTVTTEPDELTPEMLEFLSNKLQVADAEPESGSQPDEDQASKRDDWERLDFSDDFFDLETKLALCQSSL